jgi:hypothetical protein
VEKQRKKREKRKNGITLWTGERKKKGRKNEMLRRRNERKKEK